jgi:hypothetical protein
MISLVNMVFENVTLYKYEAIQTFRKAFVAV